MNWLLGLPGNILRLFMAYEICIDMESIMIVMIIWTGGKWDSSLAHFSYANNVFWIVGIIEYRYSTIAFLALVDGLKVYFLQPTTYNFQYKVFKEIH